MSEPTNELAVADGGPGTVEGAGAVAPAAGSGQVAGPLAKWTTGLLVVWSVLGFAVGSFAPHIVSGSGGAVAFLRQSFDDVSPRWADGVQIAAPWLVAPLVRLGIRRMVASWKRPAWCARLGGALFIAGLLVGWWSAFGAIVRAFDTLYPQDGLEGLLHPERAPGGVLVWMAWSLLPNVLLLLVWRRRSFTPSTGTAPVVAPPTASRRSAGPAPAIPSSGYVAFISYRTRVEPDASWARALQRAIESYRVPRSLIATGRPRRLGPVFVDTTELASVPDLDAELRRRVEASEYLVVVCSEETVVSPYIEAEVQHFIETRGRDRVCPLLISGEVGTSFPRPLREKPVPLAANIVAPSARLARRLFRTERLRIIARLLDCQFDELVRRQQRRDALLLQIGVAAAAVLVGAAFFLGHLYLRTEAADQTEYAHALVLRARQSVSPPRGLTERGAVLALESLRSAQSADAVEVLCDSLRLLPEPVQRSYMTKLQAVRFSADGTKMWATTRDMEIGAREVTSEYDLREPYPKRVTDVESKRFAEPGAPEDTEDDDSGPALYGRMMRELERVERHELEPTEDRRQGWIARVRDGELEILPEPSAGDGSPPAASRGSASAERRVESECERDRPSDWSNTALVVGDGEGVALVTRGGLELWTRDQAHPERLARAATYAVPGCVQRVAVRDDGLVVALASSDALHVVAIGGAKLDGKVVLPLVEPVTQLAYASDRSLYALGEELVLRIDGSGAPRTLFRAHGDELGGFSLSADGRVVVVASRRGVLSVVGSEGRLLATVRAEADGSRGVGPDGRTLVAQLDRNYWTFRLPDPARGPEDPCEVARIPIDRAASFSVKGHAIITARIRGASGAGSGSMLRVERWPLPPGSQPFGEAVRSTLLRQAALAVRPDDKGPTVPRLRPALSDDGSRCVVASGGRSLLRVIGVDGGDHDDRWLALDDRLGVVRSEAELPATPIPDHWMKAIVTDRSGLRVAALWFAGDDESVTTWRLDRGSSETGRVKGLAFTLAMASSGAALAFDGPTDAGGSEVVGGQGITLARLGDGGPGAGFSRVRILRHYRDEMPFGLDAPGERLATLYGGDLRISSVSSGWLARTWSGFSAPPPQRRLTGEIRQALRLSESGRYIVTTGAGGLAQVWDLTTGAEVWRHEGLQAVRLTADDRFVVGLDDEGVLHTWLWQYDDLKEVACRRLASGLTREKWHEYLPESVYAPVTCPALWFGER